MPTIPINIDDGAGGAGDIFSLYVDTNHGTTGIPDVGDLRYVWDASGTASAVPEPQTYALIEGVAVLGLAYLRRRKA
ncbi:PEP-CTERM sorting domain-containing protein [Cerasicoccus maritimus]|uniref:PEP-CTERM sorting domain-containing protein n=1 Tax=Cerasicoccus maritimus TaxID=490089 RepID=UPI0028529431|nr:PEP-CTERM sorting domain-containing protein [Cerasicoccus maritimus]